MKPLFLVFLMLLLPFASANSVTVFSNPFFNPLDGALLISIQSDYTLDNASLMVFGEDGEFSQDLVIRDFLGNEVNSLDPNLVYSARWRGFDELGDPLPKQRYIFKLVYKVGSSLEEITDQTFGFTRLDLQLNKPEYTRSQLRSAFPPEDLNFIAFPEASDETKFVLVLEEDIPLYEMQDIELTSAEVEGINPDFVSVEFEKVYKFYPNKEKLNARERLKNLLQVEAKLNELKKKRSFTTRAAVAAQAKLYRSTKRDHGAIASVISALKDLDDFRNPEAFFSRRESLFKDSLLSTQQTALDYLRKKKIVDLGEPYVVTVKENLPKTEFAKQPSILLGKIRFKYRLNKEAVRNFSIKKFNVQIDYTYKDSVNNAEKFSALKNFLRLFPPKFVEDHLDKIVITNTYTPSQGKTLYLNSPQGEIITLDFFKLVINQHPNLLALWPKGDQDFATFATRVVPKYKYALESNKGDPVFDADLVTFKDILEKASNGLLDAAWWTELEKLTLRDYASRLLPYSIADEAIKQNLSVAEIKELNKALGLIRTAVTSDEHAYAVLNKFENRRLAFLFVKHPDIFVDIANAAKKSTAFAFKALGSDNIIDLFEEDPELIRSTFVEMANTANSSAAGVPEVISRYLFQALQKDEVSYLFVRHPDLFVDMANNSGMWISSAFKTAAESGISDAFLENPLSIKNALNEVSGLASGAGGNLAHPIINCIKGNESMADLFVQYSKGETEFRKLHVNLLAQDTCAIEVGHLLDYLHNENTKRKAYLATLSTTDVFALLLSNPQFFYTSSNDLLFDRLKEELAKEIDIDGKKITTVTGLFNEFKVSDELRRNFIFRAINYDRFFGRSNSLFIEAEVTPTIALLMAPIASDEFDEVYYFLLANGLDKFLEIGNEGIKTELVNRLDPRLNELKLIPKKTTDQLRIRSALEFLAFNIDASTPHVSADNRAKILRLRDKAIFDPSKYLVDGKLQVLQVFDKEDTEKVHWKLSKGWFRKLMGRPNQGSQGELIHENSYARVILFMGETEKSNRTFISRELRKNPSQILTFRGHSYSLTNSFPYGIFDNRDGNILFIPGSCGSAGSTPRYIVSNPKTDFIFISNTSTGKGQVTNALVEILIKASRQPPQRFTDILLKNKSKIVSNGGKIETLKVYSLGEALLDYVYST